MDSVEIEILANKAKQDRTFKLGELPAAAASQSRLPISFREKLGKVEQGRRSWDKVCIYRVPRDLRDVHNKAYEPRILSIGPYHRGKEGLEDMDQHKWRCLHQVLKRTKKDASLYFDSIREIELQARSCYDEPIDLTSDQFVETMVLDGCFLLELFHCCGRGFEKLGYSCCDPVFGSRRPYYLILGDIIKLENQLPLFVLDRLLELQIGKSYEKGLLIKPILQFMGMEEKMDDSLLSKYENCLHCLDILRQCLLPPIDNNSPARQKHPFIDLMTKLRTVLHLNRLRSRSSENVDQSTSSENVNQSTSSENFNQSTPKIIPCVAKIREAGIKLETRESNCFLDIKFKDGVLKMPPLLFDESLKFKFRNLIAFEQCHLDWRKAITSYALFMDHLIDTSEDVSYLHNLGILESSGGSYKEDAEFFNCLCDHVTSPDDSYLWEVSEKLSEQVTRYHKNK